LLRKAGARKGSLILWPWKLLLLGALKTCKALRYEKVQFERDAKIVVDAINNGEVDRGRIGHVVEENPD
jgi:ribonuclease HI